MKEQVETKSERIFNTPFEVGLRSLFILSQSKKAYSIQTLIYFDYFLIHSGELPDGPESLHPNLQNIYGEVSIKRDLMKEGLRLMHAKGLVDVVLKKSGIYYKGNKITPLFVDHYEDSDYLGSLKQRAKWTHDTFGKFSEAKLKKFIKSHFDEVDVELLNQIDIQYEV